jgi:hypothetical protein
LFEILVRLLVRLHKFILLHAILKGGRGREGKWWRVMKGGGSDGGGREGWEGSERGGRGGKGVKGEGGRGRE